MKNLRALIFASVAGLLTVAVMAEDKIITLSPGEVKEPAAEEEVAAAAKHWGVSLTEKTAPSDFDFFLSALPELGGPGCCVTGVLHRGGPDLRPGYPDLRTGTIIVRRQIRDVMTQYRLELSVAQTKEVFAWFWDSSLLDAAEPSSLPPTVIDGVDLAIRTIHDQRTRYFRRDAYANPKTEKLYARLKALLVWTERK